MNPVYFLDKSIIVKSTPYEPLGAESFPKSSLISKSVSVYILGLMDAVYHIVIIFLHMNFGVVVSLFFVIINIQCQGS
jgi:hypothetical protein